MVTIQEIEQNLRTVLKQINKQIEQNGIKGRTVTLKFKHSDFTLQTRSRTQEQYPDEETFWKIALELLHQ